MSIEIRRIVSTDELTEFARISNNAYPAFPRPLDETLERIRQRCPRDHNSEIWGAFEGEQLLGGMRLLDFEMNYFGRYIPAGGVGMVAVDLLHKKRGVARKLIEHFLDDCEANGQYLAMLYPFRPDFYHKMGFGYGPKMHQYSFAPSSLPRSAGRHGAVYLTLDDMPLLADFHRAESARRHGYCLMGDMELEGLWKDFGEKRNLVGHMQDGRLGGYLAFSFRRCHENNFICNDMVIRAWRWNNQASLAALCGFIHTQADQVNRVVYTTQMADFQFLLSDVRNQTNNIIPSVYHECNTSGVGLMYRVVSVPRFLEATSYRNYGGTTAQLNLTVHDSFRPQNAGVYGLAVENGALSLSGPSAGAIDMTIDVADLSALLMGSVDIGALHRLSLVQVDDAALPVLESVFRAAQKPECLSAF